MPAKTRSNGVLLRQKLPFFYKLHGFVTIFLFVFRRLERPEHPCFDERDNQEADDDFDGDVKDDVADGVNFDEEIYVLLKKLPMNA